MEIKKLQDNVAHLHDMVQSGGDLMDADAGFLTDMLEHTGQIILNLESDPELAKMVLTGTKERSYMLDLKTLAVAVAKAIPLKEKLDDILGGIDWWDLSDMVDDLYETVGWEVDQCSTR